ncbi:Synapsin [Trichinella pseudospiralis]
MQNQTPSMNFNAFKDSFTQGVSFLKRRFSSSDLTDDVDDDFLHRPGDQSAAVSAQQQQQGLHLTNEQLNVRRSNFATSAPTSPARQPHATSLMQGITKSILHAASPRQMSMSKENSKCLLIIDNQCVDWSKYFRGRKVLGDCNLRVEQTEFSKISILSQSDPSGCLVEAGGRPFRPDFVLIRQPVKELNTDWRPIIMGMLYGAVPSLNTLHSIYNFADKPWVFSHMLMLQRRLGTDRFPLIEQLYAFNQQDLCKAVIRLPSVIKVGQTYKGAGKVKVNVADQLEELSSMISILSTYYTTEPFVDAKYDIVIQKIGPHCKAFVRKGIGSAWKTNTSASMLEQVALTDRYREWISEASKMFGGLDMCSIAAVVGKDGKEYIYEMNDCTFPLLGDTQEEDRKQIAELVVHKINHILSLKQAQQRKESMGSASPQNFIKHETPAKMSSARMDSISNTTVSDAAVAKNPGQPTGHAPPPVPARPANAQAIQRQLSQQNSIVRDESTGVDDTMSNLKKTFAGIFGDM